MEVKHCKACGAPIVWLKTVNGKNMPCDAEAVNYQANIKGAATIVTEDGRVLRADIITPEAPNKLARIIDGSGHIPHWATCPNAGEFRRGKK